MRRPLHSNSTRRPALGALIDVAADAAEVPYQPICLGANAFGVGVADLGHGSIEGAAAEAAAGDFILRPFGLASPRCRRSSPKR